MQRFRSAVIIISKMRARQAIKDQIRARGDKVSNHSHRDICVMADDWLAQHKDEIIPKAVADCLTFPEFSPWRSELESYAQIQKPQISTTSTLQISGAK